MEQQQLASWSGRDMLTDLAPELRLIIMSNLTAKDLINLKYTNRTMNASISAYERPLSRPLINQQVSRINNDCEYMNLHGLSIEEGLRRWCKWSDPASVRHGFQIHHMDIGSNFIAEYLEQNKGKYPNQLIRRCALVTLILKVDYWFQHRTLPLTVYQQNYVYANNLNIALSDAVDNFDDLGLQRPQNPWEHLIYDHYWIDPRMAEELRVIFDNIQHNPILVRSEWPRDHVFDEKKSQTESDGSEQPELFLLSDAVGNLIAPDMRKSISGFVMCLAMKSKSSAKAANRYVGTKKEEKCGLNWAALLESTEVVYNDHTWVSGRT